MTAYESICMLRVQNDDFIVSQSRRVSEIKRILTSK